MCFLKYILRSLVIILLHFIVLPIIAQKTIDYDLLRYASEYNNPNTNIDELYDYLSLQTDDDLELLELFFYWISVNIEYDIQSYIDKSYLSNFHWPLQTKKGLCTDFAKIFNLLCDKANIVCYTIDGYAKSSTYENGDPLSINHTWNIVNIDNNYKVVDVTWGSGFLSNDNQELNYHPQIDLHYFLTEPSELALTHLPGNPLWQLKDRIIHYEEFVSSQKRNNILPEYQFDQKLNDYKAYDHNEQAIIEKESIFEFNKDEPNRFDLITTYIKISYSLAYGEYNPSKINQAQSYLIKAMNLLIQSKHKIELEKQYLKNIKGGIKYCDYRLQTKR